MLSQMDTAVFNLINKGCSNDLFDFLMPLLTVMGSGAFMFIVGVTILLVTKNGKKMSALLLLSGLTVSYYMLEFLKDFIGRPRPFMLIPSVNLLAVEKNYSMPSGHATLVFMAALILSRFFGRYAWFYILAVIVGFSRVYIGVHYVSDVVAGALLGTLIGYCLLRITKDIQVKE